MDGRAKSTEIVVGGEAVPLKYDWASLESLEIACGTQLSEAFSRGGLVLIRMALEAGLRHLNDDALTKRVIKGLVVRDLDDYSEAAANAVTEIMPSGTGGTGLKLV